MNKQEIKKLFKKLFTVKSRTRANWNDFINSLMGDEITARQGRVYKYSGSFPSTTGKDVYYSDAK